MNELRKKYKEETKQPITEKPTGNFDYFKDEYVFWLEEHLAAINYTRCSLQLKELDSDNFEDWLIVNGYAVFDDYYLKNDIAFSESDLIEIYNKEVMNL